MTELLGSSVLRQQAVRLGGRSMPRALAVVLSLLVALFLRPSPGLAGNPAYRLRTIETEHFVIHYPSGLEAVATP